MNNRIILFVLLAGLVLFAGAIIFSNNLRSLFDHGSGMEDTTGIVNQSDYRDSFLIKVDASAITKAEWTNAAGRKEAISKEENVWHYAGMEALDTIKSREYFRQLSNLKGKNFSLRANTNGLVMREVLTLYGNNMGSPVTMIAYADPDNANLFLIHSSDNPQNIFISDSSGIYQQIFGDLRQFWPDGQ